MLDIQIRKATLSDLSLLKMISIQTFTETFAAVNTEANIETYITNNLNEKVLIKELANKQSAFYLALKNDTIVGYLKINWGAAQTESLKGDVLEIHRIYVLQEFKGKKIGQHLLLEAIAIARRKELEYLWLGVWENNHNALAFYKKNDFIAFGTHNFTLGEGEQTDLLLKLQLKK
ncbi:MAG: ribosomal protein S18 acetylase RimI-like enzyme [Flavobacteriales bacterium]|jgi:ribosomal protein S18 acetylase RimI-like enzyme